MKKSYIQALITPIMFLLLLSSAIAAGQSVKILPLGNSLTEGRGSLPMEERVSYRLVLKDSLTAEGYSSDMIGHKSSGSLLMTDTEHAGIPNTSDSNVLNLLQTGEDIEEAYSTGGQPYLDVYSPDIVLLHIGTNDVLDGEGSSADTIARILDEIDAWEVANGKHVQVFVARIVNTYPLSSDISDLNDNIALMVADRGDPGLVLVDMELGAGIDYPGDFEADGIHLLQSGYDKMGKAWALAVADYLNGLPDAPDMLASAAVTSSSIELNWNDNSSDENGFEIEQSLTGNDGDFSPVHTTEPDLTSYTLTSLSAATTYYFRVRAVNNVGPSAYTEVLEVTTDPEIPAAPGDLVFSAVTSSSITLNWTDNSDNEDSFEIFMSTGSSGGFSSQGSVGTDVTTFTVTGLSEETTYYFRIVALNAAGSSSVLEGNETTLPSAPAAPTDLAFSGVSSASVSMSWTDNADNEDWFTIHRALSEEGDYNQVGTTPADEVSYLDTNEITPLTDYFYRVYAVNTGGSSGPASGNVTTLAAPPIGPSNLRFGEVTNNSIELIWDDHSTDETGFRIYARTSIFGSWLLIGSVGANVTTYLASGLVSNTQYYFRVFAYKGFEQSSSYAHGSETTLPDPPAKPSLVDFENIGSTSLDVVWEDNSDNETGFRIERSRYSSFLYQVVGSVGADVTRFTDTGLTPYRRYYYRVYAVNAGGSSDFSQASVRTLPLPPSSPSNLSTGSITASSVELFWTDNSNDEEGFEIYRSTAESGLFVKDGKVAANVTSYVSTSLLEETSYNYRVYAFNSGGSSDSYASASATTMPTLPVAPDGLDFSEITSSSMVLSWNDNSFNEDEFSIYRANSVFGSYTEVGSVGENVTSFEDTGLDDNKRYYYRVYAENLAGASAPATGNAMTELAPPEAPSDLQGSANNVCSVDLIWTDNSDNEAGFIVQRREQGVAAYTVVADLSADSEEWTDLNTENLTTYYYRVLAYNSAGTSAYSAVETVVVNEVLDGGTIGSDQEICPLGDPEEINSLTAASGGSGNWSYQWKSRPAGGVFSDIAGATGLSYDPPEGLPETTFYLRMATVECGEIASNFVTITVEDDEAPVFTSCPEDVHDTIERNENSSLLLVEDPVVEDNCDLLSLVWELDGATIGSSPGTGINYLGSCEFNLGTTEVSYTATDLSGNESVCSFDVVVSHRLPTVTNVSIPNAAMKIGDIISATIRVFHDGGSSYSLVSGTLGGYSLYNLQRVDETTYLANFEVVEGGDSFLPEEDIPVAQLVLSDGTVNGIAYNELITQDSDPIDAANPEITTMSVQAGIYKIGDVVEILIQADGESYSLLEESQVNGISADSANIQFVELGGGHYRLLYTVEEGETDVMPGELEASVVLAKPSGNIGEPYALLQNVGAVIIDANPPVVDRLEVPDLEVGVGGIVQVTITADDEGYGVATGTIINGVPISSDRVTFTEFGDGLYELAYEVDEGDVDVAPGMLDISVVLIDPAGNECEAAEDLELNELEIYTDLPIALLAGTSEVCRGDIAELTIFLNGREPWYIELSDGTDTMSYTEVSVSNYSLPVMPDDTTTYQILLVRDVNGVENTGSGVVTLNVNPVTDVEITNLASAYPYDADPVILEANIPGGIFSGPGVFSGSGTFDPAIADTINSPHDIVYSYVNQNGCVSYDTALVFVLGNNGGLYIPDDRVCANGGVFLASASNVTGIVGQFSLTNASGNPVGGLTDNGNNTASINPANLSEGEYTIHYTYVDRGATLNLSRTFTVETISPPIILGLEESYCQNSGLLALQADVEDVVFEGPGVISSDSGYYFDPLEVSPGVHSILCRVTTGNGCSASSLTELDILSAPVVDFSLNATCIADTGGIVGFRNLTKGKLGVKHWLWTFGDPGSGALDTSRVVSPDHHYERAGTYSIFLSAIDSSGCLSEKRMDKHIGTYLSADFTWTSDCLPEDDGLVFMDRTLSGQSPADTAIWSFMAEDGSLLQQIGVAADSGSVKFDFAQAGLYRVELLTGTAEGCMDSITKDVNLRQTVKLSESGFTEAFDLSTGGWTMESEDQVSSWVWETPDFDGFEGASGDRAFFTRLPETQIGYEEHSWVQSPCYDFSEIDRPMISMDLMRSFAPERDGAVLQYQLNREDGWQTVGELESGIGWYNIPQVVNKPGGSEEAWGLEVFNPDTDWQTAVHGLKELAGEPGVMFRVILGTQGREGIGNQGFAFDNVSFKRRTRKAVLEYFTNSADLSARNADELVDAFAEENHNDVIDLQYHMDYPGNDPMNQNNQIAPETRAFNYGIPTVPYAVMDGGFEPEYRFDFAGVKATRALEQGLRLTLYPAEFDLDLSVNWEDSGLEATTTTTCRVASYVDNLQLYVVVFEREVTAYTGENGDTEFRNVVLDMLPTPSGKLIGSSWSFGQSDVRTNTWDYKSYVEDVDDLGVAAFIQDRNSKRILQANVAYKKKGPDGIFGSPLASLALYPNPARKLVNVNLGRQSGKDGRLEIVDVNGRVVQIEFAPEGYQIYQIDLSSLNRGFYLINWYEGDVLRAREKLLTID
ncbi:MAG: hypothetical protein CSA96_06525 [Bacteroidetes bacterium]|nr:MAG: hypothetical protein CSA96_06525 [Bacteroidota bacterium]